MTNGNLASEVAGLGNPIKTFTVNRMRAIGNSGFLMLIGVPFLIWGIIAFLRPRETFGEIAIFVVGMALLGIYLLARAIMTRKRPKLFPIDATTESGRSAIWGLGLLIAAVLFSPGILHIGFFFAETGLLLIGIAVLGLVRNGNPFGSRAILFSKGFSYTSRGITRSIHWNEIKAILIHTTQYTTYMILRLKDGTNFEVSNVMLKDFGQLLAEIATRFTESILPTLKHQFEKGQQLDFGPVTLSREGIARDKQFIQWGEIERLRVSQKGDLDVVLRGGKVEKLQGAKAVDIPNFEALLKIVDHALLKYS